MVVILLLLWRVKPEKVMKSPVPPKGLPTPIYIPPVVESLASREGSV